MRYFLRIVFTVLLMTTFTGAQQEGDLCVVAETVQPGVCRHFLNCTGSLEAAIQGKPPQMCASSDNKLIVCCPWVPGQETGLEASCQANTSTPREGDNCTMVDTERAGVCRPFANCQTAKEAASKGVFPQSCHVEGTVHIVCCPLVTVVEGSNCTVKDTGIAGVCKPFANCWRAMKAASRGIVPQRCDLTDNESELMCCAEADCPPLPKGLVTQLPTGSKAADYCIKLAEKIHPCQETRFGWTRGDMCPLPTPDSNIEYHNTRMTTTSDDPYSGLIGSGQRGKIHWQNYFVSLVSDQWVVCAACAISGVIGSKNVNFVGLGGTFIPRYNPDEIYGVAKQYIHPQYNGAYSTVYNNIALLRLDREVTFTNRIFPACLHTGTPLPNSGFIFNAYAGLVEYKLTIQRISEEECTRIFPPGGFGHPAGVQHDMEICSRPVNTTGACLNWHSGALLTIPNSHRVTCTRLLVGLGSWHTTSPCTHTYIRISTYIPWIEGIVWPENSVVV